MHRFRYNRQNQLVCESVTLEEIASQVGTPVYVYSAGTIREVYHRLQRSLAGLDIRICQAVRVNANLAVLRLFHELGAGFDVTSGGEIQRVFAAGGHLKASVFGGVGKTAEEIELALEHELLGLHVDSEPELERIDRIAGRMGRKAPVALRVRADRPASAGGSDRDDARCGIPLAAALDAHNYARDLNNIRLQGLHLHIGSRPLEDARGVLEKMLPAIERLKQKFAFRYLSLGLELGVEYEEPLAGSSEGWREEAENAGRGHAFESLPETLEPLHQIGLPLLMEPGSCLTGNAGILLTRVEYIKRVSGRTFVIVDAAMNDLMRPALYQALHPIVPVRRNEETGTFTADVVGPISESIDTFAAAHELQRVREGELLAVMNAGAGGFVMASRFHGRPLPAEVMVQGDHFAVVTARETFPQMIANEKIPDFL